MGVILKEEKKSPLLWARDSLGGILGDNLGEGNCESKIVARQWGVNFAARHQGVSQGPLGVECGNRLRVGVLVVKTLECRGLRVGPSKRQIALNQNLGNGPNTVLESTL